jgi:transposase InsO family protein
MSGRLGLTNVRETWGFGLCFLYLRAASGRIWNHKRVYRIYRELELNLRIEPRKRLKRDKPDAPVVPSAPNRVWSMDFMGDRLGDGRAPHAAAVLGSIAGRFDDHDNHHPHSGLKMRSPREFIAAQTATA